MSGESAHETYLSQRIFGSLDGLRGVSILAVVWHHTAAHAFPHVPLLQSGGYGVALFFVISGFLITTLLLREKEQHGDISLRAFYARRALRIFPLYYAVLLGYTALVLLAERGTPEGAEFLRNLPYFATYTNNYFVPDGERVIFYFAWSLAVEEQFYLVWPFLEKRVRRELCLAFLITLIFVTVVQREVLLDGLEPKSGFTFLVSRFATPIFLGVLCAHLLHDAHNYQLLARALGRRFSVWLVAALTLVALAIPRLPMTLVHVLFACLVIACVVKPRHSLGFLFENPILRKIGAISYGIYLFHMLCMNGVRRALGAVGFELPLLVFATTSLVAIGVALVSHRYFEGWFLRHKQRFGRA
jgi:peptidoglycan/LPS O-acetylase OafA/YrhL